MAGINWRVTLTACIAVILGGALILMAREQGSKVLPLLASEFGIALLVFAVLEITIHLPLLKDYFLDNLKNAITSDEYLSGLGEEQLKMVVKRIFGIKVKADSDKKDFLDYVQSQAFDLLEKHYRRNLVSEITCRELDAERVRIHDLMTYECMSGAGSGTGKRDYQKSVRWTNGPEEIDKVVFVEISLRDTTVSPNWEVIATQKDFSFYYEDIEEAFREAQPDRALKYYGLNVLIPERFYKDKLEVKVRAEYIVKNDRFQFWHMAALSDKFTLTLRMPEGYKVDVAVFEPESYVDPPEDEKDYYRIHYRSWAVPDSGVSWRFRKMTAHDLVTASRRSDNS